MKNTAQIRAWGSAGHYIQGPGIFNNLPFYIKSLGERAGFLIDQFLFKEWKDRIKASYISANLPEPSFADFSGEITRNQIVKLQQVFEQYHADVIVGFGGGKTVDTAKALAAVLNKPLVICSTLAATDAPTSAMSILYNELGEMNEILFLKSNPDFVLADSTVIAEAPVRFLISGMGDALSTYFEAKSNEKTNHSNYILPLLGSFSGTKTGYAISRYCYEVLLEKGLEAKLAAEKHILTPAVEDIIECNILMSGLGFENAGCSVAHAIGNAITAIPEGERKMHGERVAFGVVCQLIAESYEHDTIECVMNFMLDVGLPVTFEDLDIPSDEANLKRIASASMKAESWSASNFTVTLDHIMNLLKLADTMGCFYKKKRML